MRKITNLPDLYYITYNPHFDEYHAIRQASGCSLFSSPNKDLVIAWIYEHSNLFNL